MAKRTKPKTLIAPIGTMEDVSEALAEIAELERAIETVNNKLNEDIDTLKKAAETDIEAYEKRKESLGAGLYNFAELNKAEIFKKSKSREFVFGVIGYRKSTSLGLLKKISSTWKEVLGRLKEYKFNEAIRTKEEVDKEIMSQWPKERLALVGIERIEKDDFYYEVKQEKVASQS